MEGFEVGLGDLLVTAAALVHDVQAEIGEVGALDAVGRMAVVADRERLGRAGDLGAVDARGEQFVNAAMAFGAGLGDVGAIDAGARVASRQFVMRRVAIGAVGGDGEAGLEKSFAVDALAVAFDDEVLLAGVAKGGLLSGLVALGAQGRDVAREGRRGGIEFAACSVRAVAILAERRVGTALRGQRAVRALAVLGHHLFVTDGAIHLALDGDAGPDVGRSPAGVALHAGDAGVARAGEFIGAHVQRPGLSVAGALQGGIGVAAQAIAVGHPLAVVDLADLVRLVAIHAGRNQVRLLLPQLAANHLAVHGFDFRVAPGAGFGDVLFGDGGSADRCAAGRCARYGNWCRPR